MLAEIVAREAISRSGFQLDILYGNNWADIIIDYAYSILIRSDLRGLEVYAMHSHIVSTPWYININDEEQFNKDINRIVWMMKNDFYA